jgi:tRNA dimethylallyltransferase
MKKKYIVAVLGPTCTGKTALAVRLAERFSGEVISADSMQVYRELDIGTAKPGEDEMRGVPHHLIDILECEASYSAGLFSRMASEIIADLHRQGKLPIIAGGTGLYLRSLFYGLFSSPSRNEDFRKKALAAAQRKGAAFLHGKLARVDPETAESTGKHDLPRIVRALELYYLTGRTKSDFIRSSGFSAERYRAVKIGLTMPRPLLYECINRRVDRMMERGLLQEVEALLGRGVPADCHAFNALGYRQLVRHLRDSLPLDEAVRLIKRDTRRFAKRQMTWFSREESVIWFEIAEIGQFPFDEIISRVEAALEISGS